MPLQRRAILSTAFVVLVFGTLTGLLVGRAGAHADLLTTAPVDDELLDAVPDAVELTFSEAVEAGSGGVRVLGPDGERVEGEPTTSEDDRTVVVPVESEDRGTYTVAWRLVSEDGHTIEGSIVFHVGERTGAADVDGDDRPGVSALGGVGRWLGYAGSMVAVGALAFGRAVLGTWRLDGPRRRLVATGAALALAGSLAVLLVSAALPSGRSLAGAGGLLGETVTGSRPGAIAAVRGLLALLLLVAVLLPERRVPTPITGTLAVSLLLAPAVNGHAWTTDPRGLLVAADGLHLLAVSVWIGGLVALLVSVPGADDGRALARRFSAVALPAAAAVVATGSFLAVFQTRSVDAVTDTGYGQLLALKVLGVVALLALGWWSRRLVSSAALRLGHLLASVRAEVAVVALVIAATAVLVNWVPARQALAQPVSLRLEAGSGTVQLGVEPAEVGPNDLDVYLYDEAGRPAAADAVEVTATAPGVPERRLDVEPITPDHFSVLGASLGRAGTWTVSITTVAEGTPTTTTFEVPVR